MELGIGQDIQVVPHVRFGKERVIRAGRNQRGRLVSPEKLEHPIDGGGAVPDFEQVIEHDLVDARSVQQCLIDQPVVRVYQ